MKLFYQTSMDGNHIVTDTHLTQVDFRLHRQQMSLTIMLQMGV